MDGKIKYLKKENEVGAELVYEKYRGIDIPVFKYPILEETGVVKHLFSTRTGGVSEGVCATMNLSYSRGDRKESVDENFRRIAAIMDGTVEDIVCSDQTHTTNVIKITAEHRGNGVAYENRFHDVDGMITDEKDIILATFYADCVPLYFVDVKNKAIGLAHSGWKGTVGRIGREVVSAMEREYGTKAEDLVCAIGPSICKDCYEISEDVASAFEKEFPDYVDDILENKGNGKYHLDLWRTCRIILEEAGVKPENIALPGVCTCCNHELLFSHRASMGKRGNLGAFMKLV